LEFRIEDKKRIPIEAQGNKFAAFFFIAKLEMKKKQFMDKVLTLGLILTI